MRILSLPTLRSFHERPAYADSKEPLLTWHGHVLKAKWQAPADVKADLGTANILKDGRVVFNITGNKYRLVTSISYPYGIVFVKFVARTSRTTPSMHKLSRDSMDIKPIRTEADYQAALREVESLMSAEFGTPEGDRLDVLATLVDAYEAKHFPMEVADPIEAIKFQMDQKGLTVKDLEPMIGRSNRVYEVLNRVRPLTLPMIWRLHKGLGIPAETLIQPPKGVAAV